MEHEEIEKICVKRLDAWKEVLINMKATPVVLFGIEHGAGAGKIHMVICENMSDDVTKVFLLKAIENM